MAVVVSVFIAIIGALYNTVLFQARHYLPPHHPRRERGDGKSDGEEEERGKRDATGAYAATSSGVT